MNLFTRSRIQAEAPNGVVATGGHLLLTLLKVYALWWLVCFAGRLGLFVWQHARLSDLGIAMQGMAFVHGWRMDTIALGYLLVPVVLVLTLMPNAMRRPAAGLVRGWALLLLLLFTFVEIASFPFFAEYDVRPNILFVEYLKYPQEVVSMLWKDQKLSLGIALITMTALVYVFVKARALVGVQAVLNSPWWQRALWCLPLLALLFCGIRSTAGRRPANISDALYSTNRVANEIAKNAFFSVAYDIFRSSSESARGAPKYGEMNMDEAYARAYRVLGRTPEDASRPFLHTIVPSHPAAKPRNLVVIIEESMGAQFVGFSGAQHSLTPNIDALAQQSIAFTDLYSNGTRSIRGLSAMTSGFLPVIGEGVVKRPKSQQGFFTLASLLKPLGYHASFIYGGAARFDEMKTWYLGNGFDEVIEQKDYDHPSFVSTWGVSDEDLFIKANERFTQLQASGKPFVSVVFSSSNHTPFELPEGKIEWEPDVPKQSVNNAIKYADYAVGRFFDLARQSSYYANTVFVLVADHNVRVYGDDVIPVPGFHIPGLIHVPGVAPLRHTELASQPDLLSTAVGMIGVELKAPILGNSIFTEHRPFTLMKFNDDYGFRRGDAVAVLRPDKPAATYQLVDGHLIMRPDDIELERDGLALLHVTEDLYEKRLFNTGGK
ncbi:MAG: LTA synthase family protein [Steroidobacteraceae bacterium]